jgi:Aldos-2-ulose dehydratase, beta-propeller domain/FG-GAP-like repeat
MEMLRPGARVSRREFLGKSAGTGLAIAAVTSSDSKGAKGGSAMPPRTRPLKWHTHPVAEIPHGYQVATADVNGNGKLDILALSSEKSIVEWYENPSWKARPITTTTKNNISLAPLVWRGYAGHGLALASDFHLEESSRGGSVWWAQPKETLQSEWELSAIGRIPTSHRLRWADLDGDGRPELLDIPILGAGAKPPEYDVGAPITWFQPPESVWGGHGSGSEEVMPWTSHRIDDSLTIVHGVVVFDWDGDGRDEFLTASFEGIHLFRSTGKGEGLRWTRRRLTAGLQEANRRKGSSEIAVGKVGNRRFLAAIEPWHGEEVAVYFEGERGGQWSRQLIDSSFHDGHALACADLDGDGNDEIVAGYRGQGTSLYVYHSRDAEGGKWERQTLDKEMAASCVVIADMNGDGRMDIVSIGAATGNVKWYENLG